MNILLIHQYAGNKGDRAVLYALVRMLKLYDETIRITVSTSDPELWADFASYSHYEVNFVPSAWDFQKVPHSSKYWALLEKFQKYTFTLLRESYLLGIAKPFIRLWVNPSFYKALKNCDKVISVGGHHFTTILSRDLVSSINYDAMATLAMHKELLCFSQSFGPFEFHNPHNRKVTLKILNAMSGLYARERQARQALLDFGVQPEKVKDTYETVLSLNGLFPTYMKPSQREKVVGIAIYATQKREKEVYTHYVHSLADFCNYVNDKGYSVRFFPMELKNTPPDDRHLIHDILNLVHQKALCECIDQDMDTPTHLQEVSKCQVFVGHKTHSTIFALACGTPLIGIAYHPKTIEFMKQFGVDNYCVDDRYLTTEFLTNAFDSLQANLDLVGEKLYRQSKELSVKIYNDLTTVLKES